VSIEKPRDWPLRMAGPTPFSQDEPTLGSAFHELLGGPSGAVAKTREPIDLEHICLRKPRLDEPLLTSLRSILGEGNVCTNTRVRAEHAYGRSYRDLVRLRAGYVPNPPDAVIFPQDQGQVASLLSWASDREVILVPYGGGSSLTGGVEPPLCDDPVLTLDMTNLSRVLSVDGDSLTARIQAGARGPTIEAALNAQGLTLGYFPQSFGFSTLGGWLATRAHGISLDRSTSIDAISLALKVVTPVGLIETNGTNSTASGVDLLQVLVGSEGRYGVISEALVRVLPAPEVRDYRGILFPSFHDGATTCRDLALSQNVRPAAAQLLDASEAVAFRMLGRQYNRPSRLLETLAAWYQGIRLRHSKPDGAVLILGFEGSRDWVASQWAAAARICHRFHGQFVGSMPRRLWGSAYGVQSYVPNILVDHRVMADTIVIRATWSALEDIREAAAGAIGGAIASTSDGPSYITVRLSNLSRSGALLHATFLANQISSPDPLAKEAQWQTVRQAVRETVSSCGGTVLHNWARGSVRTSDPQGQDNLETRVQSGIKSALDPKGVMGPMPLRAAVAERSN